MDHECCETCITGKPKARKRRRNTIWVCPDCWQAWVLRRYNSYAEDFWTWDRWPPPGPEPGAPPEEMHPDPAPPTNVPTPDETIEHYVAGILSGLRPFETEHPMARVPDARRVIASLDRLGYSIEKHPEPARCEPELLDDAAFLVTEDGPEPILRTFPENSTLTFLNAIVERAGNKFHRDLAPDRYGEQMRERLIDAFQDDNLGRRRVWLVDLAALAMLEWKAGRP